jgi:transcriptional regulator with XRE-family HTH domain
MEMKAKPQSRHLGRKISRIRELLGVKQESLAEQLGITQQAISKIEQSEQVEDTTLERIAKALGVSGEAIKNYNEESLILHIENMHDQSSAYNENYNFHCTFNPIDKLVEALDENKRLYEQLLKSEREKITLLEKMLAGK